MGRPAPARGEARAARAAPPRWKTGLFHRCFRLPAARTKAARVSPGSEGRKDPRPGDAGHMPFCFGIAGHRPVEHALPISAGTGLAPALPSALRLAGKQLTRLSCLISCCIGLSTTSKTRRTLFKRVVKILCKWSWSAGPAGGADRSAAAPSLRCRRPAGRLSVWDPASRSSGCREWRLCCVGRPAVAATLGKSGPVGARIEAFIFGGFGRGVGLEEVMHGRSLSPALRCASQSPSRHTSHHRLPSVEQPTGERDDAGSASDARPRGRFRVGRPLDRLADDVSDRRTSSSSSDPPRLPRRMRLPRKSTRYTLHVAGKSNCLPMKACRENATRRARRR